MNCCPIERKRLNGETLSLCLAGATHSFLLFSFFPYAGYMAVTLLDNGVTVDNVGMYAGMLGATFAVGRLLGFVPWKMGRKVLGEKRALVLSLGLTGLASVWVGLATSFGEALFARLAQGLANCISGSVKRAAINARHNRRTEQSQSQSQVPTEVYDHNPEALVLAVLWWGTALGPIVGGLLSDPGVLGRFVDVDANSSSWYNSYPYLLSNGCSAMLCWISMICFVVFATEDPPRHPGANGRGVGEIRPLLAPPSKPQGDNTTSKSRKTEVRRLWESFETLWKTNQDARYHLLSYWSFSFVAVCCDEALPLFLITSQESTGLGLSAGRVGLLLSATGLIVAMSHHATLHNIVDMENGTQKGLYRVLRVCAFLGSVPVALVPLSLVWNKNDHGGGDELLLGLTRVSFWYLVVLFALLRGSASLYFSLIGMATGRTLRVVHKDEAARIMTMGALLVRSIAPVVAGAIVSHFMGTTNTELTALSPLRSSWRVWIVIGLVFGIAATLATFFLAKKSGSVTMTEKQQTYIADRLIRMSSLKSVTGALGDFYGSASKSIGTRWKDGISFWRMARKSGKRRSSAMEAATIEASAVLPPNKKPPHTWKTHTVAPDIDFDSVSFFIIGTHQKDKQCAPHVLTPPIMGALQEHLPTNCSESNFWLKYSLLRDGATMHSMEAKSGLARNTILAIETLNGDVFGCFMTTPWMPSNNHYRRSGESFLWRLRKRRITIAEDEESQAGGDDDDSMIDVYSWTGENDLCQLVADDSIACGGGLVGKSGDGFGILLHKDLLSGSSGPCATYNNPCLCDTGNKNHGSERDEHTFEVANMEVWGLTPYMFVADAERNEEHMRFLKANSHASFGEHSSDGESPSSASAWSNFL